MTAFSNQKITLLGATGSIGTQVLDVARCFSERFQVAALAGGRNLERLAEQVAEFRPERVAIQQESDWQAFQELLRVKAPGFQGEVLCGVKGLRDLASAGDYDTLIVGLVGLVGLEPTLAALRAGKKVLTANKETFVAGGHLVQPYLEQVIPIDSEHSAIHQCLRACGVTPTASAVRTLYLTASGGPFRDYTQEQLAQVSLQQALKHPNWVMGPKITIDSATMMNKGLEVIEAHWLFGVPYEQIRIVVHPQSIIHSGVEFVDGSIVVQMGAPDMHVPIQYAMTYPERLQADYPQARLDFLQLSRLDLSPPDEARFPCICLAYEAGRLGGSATTVLNAADEAAVALCLAKAIPYNQIAPLIEATLERHRQEGVTPAPSLDEIFALDAWTRTHVEEQAKGLNKLLV